MVQEYDTTSRADWFPSKNPVLYQRYPLGEHPEWIQPISGYFLYQKDSTVTHNGRIYESCINNNAYEPVGNELKCNGTNLWKLYKKIDNAVEDNNTLKEWVQPLGDHDTYKLGEVVTYKGKTWANKVYENIWAPDFGWEVKE